MENASGEYKGLVKKWIINIISTLKSLPKRSDVPPRRPHPPEEGKRSIVKKSCALVGVFSSFLIFPKLAIPQTDFPGEHPAKPEYQQNTHALTLRVVPGEKSAKLYVAGHQTATADLKKQPIIISVIAWNQDQSQILDFRKDGDAYVISELPKWKEPYDLAVKMETKGKVEEMKVKIRNQKP